MTSSAMTTTTANWTQVRNETIDRFNGQTPRPDDEGPIITAYESHPTMVTRAIDDVALALAADTITHGWSILRSRVERGQTPVREASPNTSAERTKRITNAERWIHNAGHHLDEWDVDDELFGERGLLRDYAKDTTLRTRMLELWRAQRPRGLTAEVEHEAWCKAAAATGQRLATVARTDNTQTESTDENDADNDPF